MGIDRQALRGRTARICHPNLRAYAYDKCRSRKEQVFKRRKSPTSHGKLGYNERGRLARGPQLRSRQGSSKWLWLEQGLGWGLE